MKQCILFNVFPHVSSPLVGLSNEDVVCTPTVSNDFLRSTVVVSSVCVSVNGNHGNVAMTS